MNLDKLTVNVRPLHSFQAIDLGFMMARQWFVPLWGIWWRRMTVPLLLIALGYGLLVSGDDANRLWLWVVWLALWVLKPYGEMAILIYLSQKLFDEHFTSEAVWQPLKQHSIKQSLLLTLRYRFGFRRQVLMPILVLERQSQREMRQRLRVLTQSQNNAITWHTIVFNLIETLVYLGIAVTLFQLIPSTMLEEMTFKTWVQTMPLSIEIGSLLLYVVLMSVLSVFYITSGFAIYICKRSQLEGWDIELKFRKLQQRYVQMQVQNLAIQPQSHVSPSHVPRSAAMPSSLPPQGRQ